MGTDVKCLRRRSQVPRVEAAEDATLHCDEARVEAEIWYEPIIRECLFRWLGCIFHGRTKYAYDGGVFHGHVPDD